MKVPTAWAALALALLGCVPAATVPATDTAIGLAPMAPLALLARSGNSGAAQHQLQQQQQQQQPPTDPLAECFEIPQAVCYTSNSGKGHYIEAPAAALEDLVVWYRFDKNLPVDESGHARHLLNAQYALAPVAAGPGILGRGASAALDGREYRLVKANEALETPAFTVAFWFYLQEDSVGSWRTLVHKGNGPDQLTPAVLLWPDERRLHVRVSTRADVNQGSLDGTGLIPLRRWTHVAVGCTGSVLRLYVNGIKDGETILEAGPYVPMGGDLHVGRDPWRAGTKAFLDDFRWYNRELTASEVRALTFPSLTGIGADFVHLGCASCTFTDAVKACGETSHMCSLQELFSGGFQTARVMGWLAASPEVWYHNEQNQDMFTGVRKLGLCCVNP
eukprot:gnl/TRDRNA2_/TRDRNA2_40729_c0_seq1.p1 gnl/TRDRNA2_/TRDRNA2_40729_c0~~gnl/TRDRNA2_/TRDRNA2_40729_c0_seq1.p1  ORF type:complete len:390 (+),score=74.86 gnl/TRDRNA2_/TRDRNA2_40729_c0_seq1:106-1275(+)